MQDREFSYRSPSDEEIVDFISAAIERLGESRGSKAAVAREIGTTPPTLDTWIGAAGQKANAIRLLRYICDHDDEGRTGAAALLGLDVADVKDRELVRRVELTKRAYEVGGTSIRRLFETLEAMIEDAERRSGGVPPAATA